MLHFINVILNSLNIFTISIIQFPHSKRAIISLEISPLFESI